MTDAEKKAEEWAYDKVKELMLDGTIPADAGTLEIAEYGYLAGYAEAMRWRKFPDEVPTKTGEYLVQMDDNDNCGPYFTSHLYSPDCGWSVQVGQSILYWKEIGELPEGEK